MANLWNGDALQTTRKAIAMAKRKNAAVVPLSESVTELPDDWEASVISESELLVWNTVTNEVFRCGSYDESVAHIQDQG